MSPTETTSTEPSREEERPGAHADAPAARTRADRFAEELAELKIPDPAAGRASLWLRAGALLMVAGAALAVAAYALSHGTRDPLVQRDAITLGLGGVTAAVAGSALFLRYSLTGFLRFWMARQSYDIAQLADRLLERDARK
ncbi:hypothetical protein [Actinomadura sp. NPDC048394]|uniref:hypothetical protein n=1 Tax=Actinomadura sp. NPDC048394 TaxID=3158223 RepID=UPI0033FCCE20